MKFKYASWEEINLSLDIKENLWKFLKEPKLYENEWIDCFLFYAYLKGLFNENDIYQKWNFFIFSSKVKNLSPSFEKIKVKNLKELETKLKIWDGILTWTIRKDNAHISMYIGNWLYLWKLWNFPPYIYKLSELRKVLKFDVKKEIYKMII